MFEAPLALNLTALGLRLGLHVVAASLLGKELFNKSF
jgi:hypothetical protein